MYRNVICDTSNFLKMKYTISLNRQVYIQIKTLEVYVKLQIFTLFITLRILC